MSSANETPTAAETPNQVASSLTASETAPIDRDTTAPKPLRASRSRFLLVVAALMTTIAATMAIGAAGFTHSIDKQQQERHHVAEQAATDWLRLLLTIPNDPRTGNAQMEQMKRGTADPLRSRFEDTMSAYFQDYAPRADRPPLQITSVSLLVEAGTVKQARQPDPAATPILLTTTADSARSHGGHGFWADVVEQNGQYLIADFGATS